MSVHPSRTRYSRIESHQYSTRLTDSLEADLDCIASAATSRKKPSRRVCGKCEQLPAAAFDQRAHMVGPQSERAAHFLFIARPVVATADASAEARNMSEHTLDDVRLHAEIPEIGCRRSAQIMKPPRLY